MICHKTYDRLPAMSDTNLQGLQRKNDYTLKELIHEQAFKEKVEVLVE